jgi:hypothetical protein
MDFSSSGSRETEKSGEAVRRLTSGLEQQRFANVKACAKVSGKVIAKVLRQQKRFATKLLLRLKWNSPARCAQCSGGGSISMDFELKWLELLHNVLLTSN